MKQCFFGLFLCSIAAGACGGSHGPGDAGACVNERGCSCNDGRRGTKVCDVDTHGYVMCECDPGSQTSAPDAGMPRGPAADGGGGASAGRGAAGRPAMIGGQPAAHSGSDAGAPDAAAANPGKGRGNSGHRGR